MKPNKALAGRATMAGLGFLFLVPTGCSVFEFGQYDSFGDWMVGPPGFHKMLNGKRNSEGIRGDRPVIYGPFRLPEIILQPSGGLSYPERRTVTNDSLLDAFVAMGEAQRQADASGYGSASYNRVTQVEDGPDNSLVFDWFDAGAVELIPYRTWASDKGVGYKVSMTLLQPLNMTMNVMVSVVRAPMYATHDVLKLVTMPVAAIYYAQRDDVGKKPPSKGKKATGKEKKAAGKDKATAGSKAGKGGK